MEVLTHCILLLGCWLYLCFIFILGNWKLPSGSSRTSFSHCCSEYIYCFPSIIGLSFQLSTHQSLSFRSLVTLFGSGTLFLLFLFSTFINTSIPGTSLVGCFPYSIVILFKLLTSRSQNDRTVNRDFALNAANLGFRNPIWSLEHYQELFLNEEPIVTPKYHQI